MKRVSVIGAGAWGTALATAAARAGSKVMLWAREPEVVESVNKKRENILFLKGHKLPRNLKATSDLKLAVKQQVVFLVPPAQFMRATCKQLKEAGIKPTIPVVLCSKGVEQKTLKLMTEVVAEELPNPIAVLSGPTFASEVADGLPASVTIASEDRALGEKIARYVESDSFKVFYSKDLIGAEIGGALKNVIAIACGLAEGSGLGKNAKAALMTRGIKEMKRLCVAKGGRPKTLMELCGVGDLILTCSSQESRNMSLGYELGKGKDLEEIMSKRKTVAEGVASSDSVVALAKSLDVEVPICVAVHKIVHGKADIKKTIETLIKSS